MKVDAFEDFRLKVTNLKKVVKELIPTEAANRVWEQEVTLALLTTEFEKLGLRVERSTSLKC